jgi:hypothetical protein
MAKKEKTQVKEIPVSFVRRMQLLEKTCTVCGRVFTGTKKSVYCSQACKNRANYERHSEAYREMRRKSYQKGKNR